METWMPVIVENIPVAAVLIIMTRMWLTFLKDRDKSTLDTFKSITDSARDTAKDTRGSIDKNTKVLTELRVMIEERMRGA